MEDLERKINAILKIISESSKPIGSAEISDRLKELGINLTERSVRYHLKIMDEDGLTKGLWKEGRMLTEKGFEEVNDSSVSSRVGFIISKIESLAYQMDFDFNKNKGKVIMNVSFIPADKFKTATQIMAEVFDNELGMGDRVAIANQGETLGGKIVPEGKIGFGTLCSINLNGILLKNTIPVESKFGGVLQIEDYKPLRFTDLISYSASTLDPLEIFIKSKMTSVREVVSSGAGKVMAGFREIPAVSKYKAEEILQKAKEAGLGSALMVGKPGQPLLGMPVGMGRVGIVILGGLNPIAAVEEAGIPTESKALTALEDYSRLKSFWNVV